MLHEEITSEIIASFYAVYNQLGYGFLEKVYQNSMMAELTARGLNPIAHQRINVYYHDVNVGEYYSDIIVLGKVIIEIKVGKALCNEHVGQLINYLKATNIEVGMLLNFGPKAEYKREIFTSNFKKRRY